MHFKTKVEHQCVVRCRHDGHILSACVCILALLNVVYRLLFYIMVVWGCLLSWTFLLH